MILERTPRRKTLRELSRPITLKDQIDAVVTQFGIEYLAFNRGVGYWTDHDHVKSRGKFIWELGRSAFVHLDNDRSFYSKRTKEGAPLALIHPNTRLNNENPQYYATDYGAFPPKYKLYVVVENLPRNFNRQISCCVKIGNITLESRGKGKNVNDNGYKVRNLRFTKWKASNSHMPNDNLFQHVHWGFYLDRTENWPPEIWIKFDEVID